MNTATQFKNFFTTNASQNNNMEQRSFYFISGFGIIIIAMVNPFVMMPWLALINILGIYLVTISILGLRFQIARPGKNSWAIPKKLTCSVSAIVGVGLSVWAIANPQISTTLAAYLHLIGITLVTHAILGFDSFLTGKSNVKVYKLEIKPTDLSPNLSPLNKAA